MFSSGDGRNSFGADSRDVDLGGYKYAARLDLMPFGEFAKGNGDQLVDLVGEEKPKILLGFAGSLNNGASEAVGEGHGGIELYDVDGSVQYANYRKVYTDLLLKYKGFALLGEYGITTAAGLDGLYTDPFGESVLQPAEISGYYALSSAWNANLSYTYKGMWGLDLRMSNVQPEFDLSSSLIRPQESMLIGVTRYFSGQNIKVQVAAGQQDFDGASTTVGNLICQVRF
jgi:hypothetical protein